MPCQIQQGHKIVEVASLQVKKGTPDAISNYLCMCMCHTYVYIYIYIYTHMYMCVHALIVSMCSYLFEGDTIVAYLVLGPLN